MMGIKEDPGSVPNMLPSRCVAAGLSFLLCPMVITAQPTTCLHPQPRKPHL